MPLILGIDPSAKKIAIVGHETFTNTHIVKSKILYPKGTTRQTPESLAIAQTWLESVIVGIESLAPEGQRFAYIETPLVGRGGISGTIKQAFVGGIIRACLSNHGFAVIDAHPSTWRSKLGIRVGKGSSTLDSKASARALVIATFPKAMLEIGSDADLVDAAAICAYGLRSFSTQPAGPAKRPVQRHRKP